MIARCVAVLLIGAAMTAVAEEKPKVDPDALEKLRKLQAELQKQEQDKTERTKGPKATLTIEQGGTVLGDIVIALNADKAPISVMNFADYADAKYYDGTIFHRVMPNFMIQGGGFTPELDPKRTGLRAPIRNEFGNGLKNERGTISMARTRDPNSATSQFFINVVNNTNLDRPPGYCVFGKVTDGMEVVDTIVNTKTITHPKYPQGDVVPEAAVIIKSVKVEGVDRDAIKQVLAKRQEAKNAEKAKEQAALQAYAEKVAAETGKELGKTDSGIFYVILREGEGKSPTPANTVKVHYEGTFKDGKKFDSSYDRGQPAQFPLRGVIRGWTEGVSLMKVGEKRKLIIPWNLAYGERGRGSIPPKADLVFDIELIEIVN